MIPDLRTLVSLNFAVQILLAIALAFSLGLAKMRMLKRHCTIMRLAMPVQLLAILAVMLPAMEGYREHAPPLPFFDLEVLAHHSLGVGAVILWIYVNLAYLGLIRPRFSPKAAMQWAAAFWILSLLLGIHIYSALYF